MAQRVMSVRGANYPGVDDLLLSVSSSGSTAIAEIFNTISGNIATPLLRLQSNCVGQTGDFIQICSAGTPLGGIKPTGQYFYLTTPVIGYIYKCTATTGAGSWVAGAALTTSCSSTDADDLSNTNIQITPVASGTDESRALLFPVNLVVKWYGQLSIAKGGTGASTAISAFNALSPLTTIGDLLTHGGVGVNAVRLSGNVDASTKKFLTSTAASGVATIPSWQDIVAADVAGTAVTLTDPQIIVGQKTFVGDADTQVPAVVIRDLNSSSSLTPFDLHVVAGKEGVAGNPCMLMPGVMVTFVGAPVYRTNQTTRIAPTLIATVAENIYRMTAAIECTKVATDQPDTLQLYCHYTDAEGVSRQDLVATTWTDNLNVICDGSLFFRTEENANTEIRYSVYAGYADLLGAEYTVMISVES
jgi:hypothetical protein